MGGQTGRTGFHVKSQPPRQKLDQLGPQQQLLSPIFECFLIVRQIPPWSRWLSQVVSFTPPDQNFAKRQWGKEALILTDRPI